MSPLPSNCVIGGLHPLTAIDFPGRLSALVFTQGCNFHCPYCHNSHLLPRKAPESPGTTPLTAGRVLAFLRKRRGLLSGVVISGGEPCLQPGLEFFCSEVKEMGFALKLDTNGSFPDVLATLLARNLLDYVAVDVKAPLGLPGDSEQAGEASLYYPGICADTHAGTALAQSMALLAQSPVPHEFRTTCVAPFVTAENLPLLATSIASHCPSSKSFHWYLQKAVLPDASPGPKQQCLQALSAAALQESLPRLATVVPGVRIRE